MPENKRTSSPLGDDQTKKDNATLQALVPFGGPKEAVEIFHEDKMTNTEGVYPGTFFSYPCRRHSCSLVNTPAPCVNKMISHIEDVESKIEGRLKQRMRKHFKMMEIIAWFETSWEEWRRAAEKDLEKDQRVEEPSKEEGPKEERDEQCPELKQEMETLLSEAIFLIKSLETDRAEAQEALKRQHSRRRKINKTIDSWSIWRLQEMPMAVQKEHEAYMRDILELRWHIEDKSNAKKRLEEQRATWEEANAKVQADVDYMHEHRTLLNSKLMQEIEDLRECNKKKMEVMDQYRLVHGGLLNAIQNCEKMKLKVTQNREEMEKDIAKDVKNIEAYKRQVDKLTDLFGHYSAMIQTVSESIERGEEAVTTTLQETQTSTDEVSSLTKTLEELKKIYEQLVWRKNSYESEYDEMLTSFYDAKSAWETEISDVRRDLSDILIAHDRLLDENVKLEMDRATTTSAINESIMKKTDLEAIIKDLQVLKFKNDEYLKGLYKDAYHIGAVFHLTRYKTEEIEEKIAEVRRKFQGREDFLKRITRSQVANGMMLQKKLFSMQEEEELDREDLTRKKAIYSLILTELEEPMLEMEENAKKIQDIHKENADKLGDILAKRDDIKTSVERTKEKLQTMGRQTKKALIVTEAQNTLIFGEIEAAKNKTAFYEDELAKLNKELEGKEKAKLLFDQILEALREKCAYVKFKKEHMQAVYDHLISEKLACEDRLSEEAQKHKHFVTMRQRTLADIKKVQDDSLAENLRLAQVYQKLQMDFLAAKDHYCNQYDRQLSFNASIRDKRELCQLQKRTHRKWHKYLRLAILHSQLRLARYQAGSQKNILKILAVQEESSNLMHHIVEFFEDLSKGPCASDD